MSAPSTPQVQSLPQNLDSFDHWFVTQTGHSEYPSNGFFPCLVGYAEGTRSLNCGFNQAYYGHNDPGNGVWNTGSFSLQKSFDDPRNADRYQLNVLLYQWRQIKQADYVQSEISLLEFFCAIDLLNQAPKAVLDEYGYFYHLHQLKLAEWQGSNLERIIEARVRAFYNPQSGQLEAAGFGNDLQRLKADQSRRVNAIAEFLTTYKIIPLD